MEEKRGFTVGSSVVNPGFELKAIRDAEGRVNRVVIL